MVQTDRHARDDLNPRARNRIDGISENRAELADKTGASPQLLGSRAHKRLVSTSHEFNLVSALDTCEHRLGRIGLAIANVVEHAVRHDFLLVDLVLRIVRQARAALAAPRTTPCAITNA